jgi:hypothetical protein
MRCGPVVHAAAIIGLACLTASCAPPRVALPPSPGCLIHLYTGANFQPPGLPVARDTPELAPEWRDRISSVQVIWGTWRLFASQDYKDFMGDYSAPAQVPLLRPAAGLESLRCIAPEPPLPAPPAPPGLYIAP